MKINKKLSVDGEAVQLISEDVFLSLNWIGKAMFMVAGDTPLVGRVIYQVGYANLNTMHNYFAGVVDSCIEVNKGKWQIIAREYLGALDGRAPLALRHVNLKDVLAQLSTLSGIKFVTPDKAYSNTMVPFFYHAGTATEKIQALGSVFSIPDFVWFQQGDGSCFVGSYDDCFWHDKTLDASSNQSISIDGQSITLPLLPAVKPGVTINGYRVNQLHSSGSKMVAQW